MSYNFFRKALRSRVGASLYRTGRLQYARTVGAREDEHAVAPGECREVARAVTPRVARLRVSEEALPQSAVKTHRRIAVVPGCAQDQQRVGAILVQIVLPPTPAYDVLGPVRDVIRPKQQTKFEFADRLSITVDPARAQGIRQGWHADRLGVV